jgi:exosortase
MVTHPINQDFSSELRPPLPDLRCLKQRLTRMRWSLLLCLLGLGPLLWAYFADLWARPQYQFFPLALAGVVALAWRRVKEQAVLSIPGRQQWAALWLGLSLASLAVGALFWLPMFGGLSFLCFLVALALLLGGRPLLAACAPSLLILLLLIPPLGLESEVLRQLRRLAVLGSSTVLDYVGVLHSVEGNVLELPDKTMLVEEACSGINSLLLGMTFCVFYLFWRRRSACWLIVAVPATFAFVMLGNIVRITVGAVLQYYAKIDILSGHAHETAGLILVATYTLLVCSLDQLLDFLTRKPDAAAPVGKTLPQPIDLGPSFARPAWLPWCGLAYALAGIVAIVQVSVQPELLSSIGASHPKAISRFDRQFVLPGSVGVWQRCDSDNATNCVVQVSGVSSITGSYRLGRITAVLALDYPLRGYHDAKLCYSSQGWVVRDESITSVKLGRTPAHFVEVSMRKSPLLFGFLSHGVINAQGHWLEPPNANPTAALVNRFRAMGRGFLTGSAVRLQVLCVDSQAIAPSERERVRELFLGACQLLSQHLASPSST